MPLPRKIGIMSSTSSQARRAARAHEEYWTRIRSDLALCERSESVSEAYMLSTVGPELERLHDTLEYDTPILGLLKQFYPPSLRRIGLEPEMSLEKRKAILGLSPKWVEEDKQIIELQRWLHAGVKKKQASWWNFRAGEAARFYGDLGWFPFFITLTVDPKRHDPVQLWREDKAWAKYIKTLARVSMTACGVSAKKQRYLSNRNYIAYFGQLEHGKSGNHHHAHLLVWFRNIPDSWKMDPNWHLHGEVATNRRCPPLESFWPYCDPAQRPGIYFWHQDCVWQHMGHKIPVDEKSGHGLKLLAPEFAGGYLSKYMSKEDKPWWHEAKATHGLGLERLTRHLKQTSTKGLIQLARFKEPDLRHLIQTTISVPDGLLRLHAKTEIYCRTYPKMTLEQLTQAKQKAWPEMARSVKAGLKPHRMRSEAFSLWLQDVLPQETNEYCEEAFFEAFEPFAMTFNKRRFETRTIGGLR